VLATNSNFPVRQLRGDRKTFWIGLVFVFLLALLPRLFYPVSRPMLWYKRSVRFWDALQEGNLSGTYQRYHPGVSVMWIAGLGLRIYAVAHGWSGDELLNPPPGPLDLQDYPDEAGVAALSIVIAACVGLAYVLLTRLTDWSVAFSSGCLLALDPFYIYLSKMIHLDAILASFMLVSVLFLVCYLQHERRLDLVLSGIFAGLAFLTKSPSGFLLPYALMVVVCSSFFHSSTLRKSSVKSSKKGRRYAQLLWGVVRTMGEWGIVAGLVFFLVWPAVWFAPLDTLSKVVQEALFRAEVPHHDVFFAGRVFDDPGWLFYGAIIAWKTTIVTLLAICIALVFLVLQWRRGKGVWHMGWLLIYAGGFLLMMTLAAKKGERYILPVFLPLDILAAWGLDRIARTVGRCNRLRSRTWIPAVIIAAALVVQAGVVLEHRPYYSTHHNLLLGGSRVAQRVLSLGDQGEGLDLAARFLNGYPGAERRTVGLQKRFIDSFKHDFVGRTQHINEPGADYRVFAVNVNQRRLNPEEWEGTWEACQQEGPLWSVSFDGVPYAWICPAYPSDPDAFAVDHRLDVRLGDHITLLGYRLSSTQLSAGDTLTATLFWRSDGRLVGDYHVFMHLVGPDGQIAAQHDGVPVQGERPTWDWRDREVFRDEHTLILDPSLPGGIYTLSAGMYDYSTGVRPPAVEPDGDRLPEGRVVLRDLWVLVP
jgi:hypothetical protein